jgi:predicted RNA-binding protein with PIN domain
LAPNPPRSEHLLVDGYNVIKTDPHLRRREQVSLKAARLSLEQILRAYTARSRAFVTLFYDGDEGLESLSDNREQGFLQVVFSHPPEKADDLIKRTIQRQHGSGRVRVITSDREIRRFARRHKLRSTPSSEFVEEVNRLPRPPAATCASPPPPELDPELRLTPEEIEAWEQLFQRGKNED